MSTFLHNNPVAAVTIGGCFLFLAAVLTQFVREMPARIAQLKRAAEAEGFLPTATPPETPLS